MSFPDFHAHLDDCARCRERPFDLCPEGNKRLVEEAVPKLTEVIQNEEVGKKYALTGEHARRYLLDNLLSELTGRAPWIGKLGEAERQQMADAFDMLHRNGFTHIAEFLKPLTGIR